MESKQELEKFFFRQLILCVFATAAIFTSYASPEIQLVSTIGAIMLLLCVFYLGYKLRFFKYKIYSMLICFWSLLLLIPTVGLIFSKIVPSWNY